MNCWRKKIKQKMKPKLKKVWMIIVIIIIIIMMIIIMIMIIITHQHQEYVYHRGPVKNFKKQSWKFTRKITLVEILLLLLLLCRACSKYLKLHRKRSFTCSLNKILCRVVRSTICTNCHDNVKVLYAVDQALLLIGFRTTRPRDTNFSPTFNGKN